MTTIQKVLLGVALLFGISGLFFPQNVSLFGGTTNLDSLELSGTLTAAGITNSAELTVAGIRNSSGTTIGGGTTIAKYVCGTASWNPGIIASSGLAIVDGSNATSVLVESAGTFAIGKPTLMALSSVTSSLQIFGNRVSFSAYAHGTGSSTAVIINNSSGSLDYVTGTVSVCQFQ